MNLNIFAVFQIVAIIIFIGAQIFLYLAGGSFSVTTQPSRNS